MSGASPVGLLGSLLNWPSDNAIGRLSKSAPNVQAVGAGLKPCLQFGHSGGDEKEMERSVCHRNPNMKITSPGMNERDE